MEGPCLQGEGKGRESGKGNLAVLSFTLQLRLQFSSSPLERPAGGREGKKRRRVWRGKERRALVSLEGGERNEERGTRKVGRWRV